MNKRITLISHFDEKSYEEIKRIINKLSSDFELCRVPFGRNVNREEADTLPFHFTISSWDIKEEKNVISKLKDVDFKEIRVKISGLNIMRGKENSYCLYLEIEDNSELYSLQREIYEILPNEKYNPDSFTFHITIDIDKDYEKIICLKNVLENDFIGMEMTILNFGLYEIYPAKLVEIFKERRS